MTVTASAEARREHILDAAEACFVRNGFHRATMQDLAREAAMSPGNFYRYFESKEALVVGLVERECARGAERVAEMERSGDRRGALLDIIARYFVSVTREAAVLRMEIWSEATRNPAIADLTARTEAETRDWFTATFAALATSPDCDPDHLYALLAPLMKGILVSRAILPDYDPAPAVAQLHPLLEPGLDGRLPRAPRAENMPKDNIERAIKKAAGAEGENYEDIRYEGYGPGGAALIVEAQTDNRNRTASDVRSAFTKSGGSLAETGAVAFMFDRVGVIGFPASVADADTMLEAAIEAGADDVSSSEEGHEVVCAQDSYGEVAKALEARFGEPTRTGLIWKAQNTIDVDDETGEKLIRLVEVIEDQDDVQHVYVNFALSEALMAKLEG